MDQTFVRPLSSSNSDLHKTELRHKLLKRVVAIFQLQLIGIAENYETQNTDYSRFFPAVVQLLGIALSAPIINAWPERGANCIKTQSFLEGL